jgi:Undecaprenyl-phosphate glucose phosphotransferase
MNMNVSAPAVRGIGLSHATTLKNASDASEPISEPVVSGLVALTDVGLVLSTGVLAAWISGAAVGNHGHLAGAVSLLGVFFTTAFCCIVKAYRFSVLEKALHGIGIAILSLALMTALQIALTVATAGVYQANVGWLVLWFALCAPLLIISRLTVQSIISHWTRTGRLNERIAVVGATALAKQLIDDVQAAGDVKGQKKTRVIGVFDDLSRPVSPKSKFAAANVRSLDNLVDLIRNDEVDAVIVALPLSAKQRISHVLEKLKHTPVDVRVCPGYAALYSKRVTVSKVGEYAMLNVMERPLCHWKRVAKDIEDRVIGSLILLMIAPLMCVIALAIKLDSPGPVLFRQKRLGYNNKIIEVLKFRTMHHAMSDANASQLTQRNDPRVTRLGAFLRRTSLDELPQFLNVIKGDMSIVGPRPHALQAKAGTVVYHEAVENYASRHRMKPGITGWAQINGWRGETDTVDKLVHRVDHDLFYVDNWTVFMDLKIIVRTIFGGFTGKSVY